VRCILVTGGGGGDDGVGGLFDVVEAALANDRSTHIVYGAGPLYRGAPRHGVGCTWFAGHDLAEHAAAFDVAVIAAGFNTVHELLLLGVPLLCVPQDKIADDQLARARRYAERGALIVSEVDAVAPALRTLLVDDERRAALSAAALAIMPENHARDAALAVLQTVWPPSLVAATARLVTPDVSATSSTWPSRWRGTTTARGCSCATSIWPSPWWRRRRRRRRCWWRWRTSSSASSG
jgi:UDP-N-acetylglucosamine:LPS N-acetylglucosamine transferase